MKKCLVYGTFELEFVERNGIPCARWVFKQKNTFRPHLMFAKLSSAPACAGHFAFPSQPVSGNARK
jgi:hypothetical protein